MSPSPSTAEIRTRRARPRPLQSTSAPAPVVRAQHPQRIVILVQNLPVPLDRRVWCEATALVTAGHEVTVIAHNSGEQPPSEMLDGVHVRRYRNAPQANGTLGYVVEFGWCWLASLWMTLGVLRKRGVDTIHACNPPDTFWLIAFLLRPFGVRFVYDQHDLCPELFRAKFPDRSENSMLFKALRWLERRAYGTASAVISTNPSYRDLALSRGAVEADSSFIVRSSPPRERFVPALPNPDYKFGHKYTIGYIGIMGNQDGIDLLVRCAHELVNDRDRGDVGFVLIGSGDEAEAMEALAADLGLAGHVHFQGRLEDIDLIQDLLGSTDLCICPDPKTPFNDKSSMNKIVEYMALGKPVVGFDLTESQRTLGGMLGLAGNNSPSELADRIESLLEDPDLRDRVGRENRARFEEHLSWEGQIQELVDVYDHVHRSRSK